MVAQAEIHGNPDSPVLVLGASGKTGSRICRGLAQRGVAVRGVSRSTQPAFDWHEAETWQTVLDGVRAVYISYAPDLAMPGAVESIRAFVELALARGVGRLVLLSGRGEEEAQACERIVQRSGVEWTIVRASWFMQNFSEGEFADMVREGTITLPAADIPEPFVDVNDIADVAVSALIDDGHAGEVYEVTGPRLLSFSDLAAELSVATGRRIRFVRVPAEAFSEGLSAAGMPARLIWLLNYLFGTVLDGRNARLGDGVRRALKREPADFTQFAFHCQAKGLWSRDEERRA